MNEIDKLWNEIEKVIKERDQLRNALKGALADANFWANKYNKAEQELKENEGVIAVWRRRTEKAEEKLAAEQKGKEILAMALNQACDQRDEAEQEHNELRAKLTKLHAAATRIQTAYSSYYTGDHRMDCWQQLSVALKETE